MKKEWIARAWIILAIGGVLVTSVYRILVTAGVQGLAILVGAMLFSAITVWACLNV